MGLPPGEELAHGKCEKHPLSAPSLLKDSQSPDIQDSEGKTAEEAGLDCEKPLFLAWEFYNSFLTMSPILDFSLPFLYPWLLLLTLLCAKTLTCPNPTVNGTLVHLPFHIVSALLVTQTQPIKFIILY